MRYNVADKIVHRRQEKEYSCGAAAVAMLLGLPESIVRPLVKCTSKGTHSENVYSFLKSNVAQCHMVYVGQDYYAAIQHLITLSTKFPLYVTGKYVWKNPGRGRPCVRHHASAFVDGMIYDPGENRAVPGECYESTFNRRLLFRNIIVIECERPNFLKNFRQHELVA